MNSALRPMSTGEVLDRTFYLYRNNFTLFAGIMLVASLLTLATRLVLLGLFGSETLQGAPTSSPGNYLIILLVTIPTYLVVHALASGATVHAVSLVHLEQPASIHQAYSAVGSIFGRIFWIVTAVFLLTLLILIPVLIVLIIGMVVIIAFTVGASRTGGGMVGGGLGATLFIGGITLLIAFGCVLYMLSRYAFAVPACMIEKLSAGDSLKRSSFLTRKKKGRVFLVILLTGIIGIALNYVFQVPLAFFGKGTFLAAARSHLNMAQFVWLYFAEFAANVLAGPIATISVALLYYDERIRKEAFDLQLMMQSMEISAPQAATAAMPGTGAIQ